MRGTAFALIGAQWGSEGKGVIAHLLADWFDAAVRVGGPNAGHSFFHDGKLYVARSIPCIWTNPDARLFIGAGAVVNPELLVKEWTALPDGVQGVNIDPSAALITHEHEQRELETIRGAIGSTAEGVGEARVARMRRDGSAHLARDYDWPTGVVVRDVSLSVEHILEEGGLVMLEGTQGSGLSLYHGSQYPYATSTDTNASGLAAEAGVAPSDVGHVQLVARTFPIRVAGTSGPMGHELDWSYFVERGIVEQPEKTTVTKKQRRISEWYWPVVDKAVRLNRPCGIWLTFGDYVDPTARGGYAITPALRTWVNKIEARYDVPVLGVGTGPLLDDDGNKLDWLVARNKSRCAHGFTW